MSLPKGAKKKEEKLKEKKAKKEEKTKVYDHRKDMFGEFYNDPLGR